MSTRSRQTDEGMGLLIKREPPIVRLTLNRPETRNALSLDLIRYLETVLDKIAEDVNVHVIVLAAEGSVFCSGHDLSELQNRTREEYRTLFEECSRMMQRIRRQPQPVIARVQGPATAAGCQLVATCDLAVASTAAAFSTPGVKIGLFCTTPMVPLVRAIPPKAAFSMLMTGELISADRALALGLVTGVVPPDRLDAEVKYVIRSLLSASPSVLRQGKLAFYDQLNLSEAEAYRRAIDGMVAGAMSPDAREGITAFLEKRTPHWPE